MPKPAAARPAKSSAVRAAGGCVCGAVLIEIDVPAFWAWHDHSKASQHAQGCAYATYVGCWRSRFRVLKGARSISRFEEKTSRSVRSFCRKCGTPLLYERARSPKMVNIPRALFEAGTGREPRYHIRFEESPEWEYRGTRLSPLKGYPGVLWERGRKRSRAEGVFPPS
jgi:hypothetical protein